LVRTIKQTVSEVLEEQKTVCLSMSKAKPEEANDLLLEMGYVISLKADNEAGTIQAHEFDWTPNEEKRTEAAGKRLTSLMAAGNTSVPFDFVPVTGSNLHEVRKGKRKATGKADLRVAKQGWIPQTEDAFAQARGLVELKVEGNKFSAAQLHLELVSVSLASVFKQGVALLATDCLTRWGVWSFERKNVISGVWYKDSTLAIAEEEPGEGDN
jgi:hypothetical protein